MRRVCGEGECDADKASTGILEANDAFYDSLKPLIAAKLVQTTLCRKSYHAKTAPRRFNMGSLYGEKGPRQDGDFRAA